MSRPAACIGDKILCPACKSSEGNIVTGSKTTFIGGRPVVRVGDMGQCAWPTTMATGSKTVFAEGRPVHRIGDLNTCAGPTIGPPTSQCLIGD